MATAETRPTPAPMPTTDQRMLINGVSWRDYVILREALDTPGLRMTYLNGSLELMSPSRKHALHKKTIARMIEHYAFARNIRLLGYGRTTFRHEAEKRGAEPDECWCIDRLMDDGQFPDIVLEVIHTSPLLDKLEVYRGFGVTEVWLFEDGAFHLHRLDGGGYSKIERSLYLPELDFSLIARLAVLDDQHEALRQLDATIRG